MISDEDFTQMKVDVGVLKNDIQHMTGMMEELRAEVRVLTDSIAPVRDIARLCQEHQERGEDFERFKLMVNRHSTYFYIGGTVLVLLGGAVINLVI